VRAGLELRVVPSALLLILGGYFPGLVAVTPVPAAAAESAYAVTDPQVHAEPKARSTRFCSHPASDHGQDLPPARLIHAGPSSGRGEPGSVHTI
jgi:hypothetical protein